MGTAFKRLIRQPFLWIFLAGCIGINMWLLANHVSQRGLVLESVKAQEELGSLNEENKGAYIERLEQFGTDEEGMLTPSQMILAALSMARDLTAQDIADAYIGNMQLTGDGADRAMACFERFEPVLKENRAEGRANAFFAPEVQGFFLFLGQQLPLFCTLEGILANVCIAFKGMTDPFATGNSLLIFSLKTGRRLCLWKRGTAVMAGWIWGTLVWGISMGLTLWVFPLGSLWQTPVGSMMLLSGMCPLLSQVPLSLTGYMVLQFAISLAVMGLFSLFAGWAALHTKNTLTAGAGLGLVCMAVYTFVKLFPGSSIWWFAVRYNPITLAWSAGQWLVCGATSLNTVGYVAVTLILWGAAAGVLIRVQTRNFGREDL